MAPALGLMGKPRARVLRSRAQRGRVWLWPWHLTPHTFQLGLDFPPLGLWDGSDSGQQPDQQPVCTWASCLGSYRV